MTSVIFRRELASYFTTPLAYVFLVIFLLMQGLFTFYLGNFFEREQADLSSFFAYHPWLYLFLVPAVAMRLWAEERKSGTLEMLFTLPVPVGAAILGKFLAALAFTGLALLMTFPLWITVNWLGSPDNGIIITGYLGSFLMAAAYLAVGSAMSALTKNQVIAFILTVSICFIYLAAGLPLVLDFFRAWMPDAMMPIIANMSFLTHFDALQKGVVVLADVLFFGFTVILWLFVTRIILELKREAG